MMPWQWLEEPGRRCDEETDEVFTYARTEHEREVDEFIEQVYNEGAHTPGGDA